ncbi:hypothetical protein F4810DRAFT_706725 [Camillea tinctor]|nr:hypothetical protein F4810DRAFT_706725 [Camillea tinctor]
MNPQAQAPPQPQPRPQPVQLPLSPTDTPLDPQNSSPFPFSLPFSLSRPLTPSSITILFTSALVPPLLIYLLSRLARRNAPPPASTATTNRNRATLGTHLHAAALKTLRVFALAVGYLFVGLVLAPVLILHQVDKH